MGRCGVAAHHGQASQLHPQRLILEHPTTLRPPREAGALVPDRPRTYGGVAPAPSEDPPPAALGCSPSAGAPSPPGPRAGGQDAPGLPPA